MHPRTLEGDTPRDLALRYGKHDVVEFLGRSFGCWLADIFCLNKSSLQNLINFAKFCTLLANILDCNISKTKCFYILADFSRICMHTKVFGLKSHM